jgi:hypothetical protein
VAPVKCEPVELLGGAADGVSRHALTHLQRTSDYFQFSLFSLFIMVPAGAPHSDNTFHAPCTSACPSLHHSNQLMAELAVVVMLVWGVSDGAA